MHDVLSLEMVDESLMLNSMTFAFGVSDLTFGKVAMSMHKIRGKQNPLILDWKQLLRPCSESALKKRNLNKLLE